MRKAAPLPTDRLNCSFEDFRIPALRLGKPPYSFLGAATLAGAVVVAFVGGLVASGTFWYAILEFQNYSFLTLPLLVFVLFGTSAALTCLFSVVIVKLGRRLPMKFTIVPFVIGGLLAAMALIISFSIAAWTDWVTATGG